MVGSMTDIKTGSDKPVQCSSFLNPRYRQIIFLISALLAFFIVLFLLICYFLPLPAVTGPLPWAQQFRVAGFMREPGFTNLSTPAPETIPLTEPAGDWRFVRLPYTGVTRSGITPDVQKNQAVTTWYQFDVTPPVSVQQNTTELYFYLPRWKTEGRLALYQGGHLLWHSHGDIIWNSFNRPVFVKLNAAEASSLFLRMDTMAGRGGGITQAWVGQYNAVFWRYRARFTLQCIVPSIFAIILLSMAIVLFFVALARPSNSLHLLFVFASILYTVRILHFAGPLDSAVLPASWFGWATINSMCWLIVVGWLFCCGLAEVDFRWLRRLLIGGVALCTIVTAPFFHSPIDIASLALWAYIFCFVLSIPTMPLLLVTIWKRRSISGVLLLFWNILMFPVAVHDMLLADYQVSIDHLYLLPYVVPDLFLSCLYILCRHYIDALNAAERSNQQLETRLQAQSRALRNSYEQLRLIEQRNILTAERQRLMRDMHDGLGSTLTGAIHMTNSAAPHIVIAQTLKDCLDDLKLTLDSLEPVDADLLALLANLRFRLEPSLIAQNIELEWAVTVTPPLKWLTPATTLDILRILQEVITNIVKHAQASRIRLSTATEETQVQIHIQDNGKTFMVRQQTNHGRGLHNIRWRSERLSATTTWKPCTPGTCFTLHLPIEKTFSSSATNSVLL